MGRARDDVIAVIGTGEMGSAIGRRLAEMGARVVTQLKGRSGASVSRVKAAGLEVIDDDNRLVREAGYLLSIVPPAAAIDVARQFVPALKQTSEPPAFAECNAVSPATVRKIEKIVGESKARFVDAGIIGGPPQPNAGAESKGPRIYCSGPHSDAFRRLSRFGLDIVVLDGPIGAASALKLSYAGVTKGLTAIASAMIIAASREGLAADLRKELMRSQPELLARFDRFVPGMFPKAYRWVAEMEQIAEFIDEENRGASIFEGAARLYERIARDVAEGTETAPVLRDFCGNKR
jgi:3-hydroxyisobutyrate dehydrogenase-like beta-hydroxyacid dehydrogenase